MTTSSPDEARRPWREAAFVKAVYGGEPFLVKPALAAGIITRQDVRARFRRIHPKVYARKTVELTAGQKVRAAWLWAGPGSVLCGGAAAMLHGESYFGPELVDDEIGRASCRERVEMSVVVVSVKKKYTRYGTIGDGEGERVC